MSEARPVDPRLATRSVTVITLVTYVVAIALMVNGDPTLRDYGIYCWLLALVAAIASLGTGVVAVAIQGRTALGALFGAGVTLAFGVIVSLLVLASIPPQN